MADSSWSQLYDEAKSGVVVGVAEDTYEVVVESFRAYAKSRLLFLDLKIETGPLAGKIAQVNLYLPEPGNRGAGFHFRNKILGFGDLTETFKQMDNAGDLDAALNILGDALTGRHTIADIELRKDGEYAGTNQLAKTKPVDDVPTPAATVAAPAPAAVVGEPVAAAPAEADAPAAAPTPEPALSGEVPF